MITINLVLSIALLAFAFGMLLGAVSSPHAREEECGAAFRAGRCEGIEDSLEYIEIMAEVEHKAINDLHAERMHSQIAYEDALRGVPS